MLFLNKFPFIVAWEVGLELDSKFSRLSVAMGKIRPSLSLGHLTFFFVFFLSGSDCSPKALYIQLTHCISSTQTC